MATTFSGGRSRSNQRVNNLKSYELKQELTIQLTYNIMQYAIPNDLARCPVHA
jgi:hypothetical protein